MAESFVNVTEGSGKKLHTWQRTIGANNVEDEIVIPGEPYLATYSAVFATAVTLNNAANTQLVQLMAGASLKVYVRRITFYQVGFPAAATNFIYDMYRVNTAPTGGTSVTPTPYDTGDSACGATSAYLPTGAGGLTNRVNVGVIGLTAAAPSNNKIEFLYPTSGPKSLIIPAGTGNGIVIRNVTGANTGTIVGEIIFQEASF
jgi:hypothetical protein